MAQTLSREDKAARYLRDDTAKRCPYPLLGELRGSGPIVRSTDGPWLVFGYEAGQAVLRDPRLSRSQAAADTLESFIDPGPAAEIWLSKMVSTDGERHRRLRSLVNRAFTPRAVERWRPVITEHAAHLLSAARPRGEMDVAGEYGYPLSEHVICTLLGIPFADLALFESWTAAIQNRVVTGTGVGARRLAAADAIVAFAEYLSVLVAAHTPDPDGDLLAQLAAAEEDGSRLSAQELVSVTMELIIGGHETTANLITICSWELARSPQLVDQHRRGAFDVVGFVDEVMRARSPVQLSLSRVATEDVEIAGTTIQAGEIVLVSLAAANRDEAQFPGGDRFDPEHPEPVHIGFGAGAHYCLGANLARLEAQIALTVLLDGLPDLHLAANEDDLPWRDGSLVIAPSRLPVRWASQS